MFQNLLYNKWILTIIFKNCLSYIYKIKFYSNIYRNWEICPWALWFLMNSVGKPWVMLSVFPFSRDSSSKFSTDPFNCLPQNQNIYLTLLRISNLLYVRLKIKISELTLHLLNYLCHWIWQSAFQLYFCYIHQESRAEREV